MSPSMDKSEIQYIDEKAESIESSKPHQIIKIDNFQVLGLAPEDADFYINYSDEQRKRVIHKNAKIEGMVTDLGLDGVQWNIVLSVFFVPYILLEVPSNILLKKFKRPSYYLGILIVCWGIVMTSMGVVKNFAGLLATRILLGVFEAGFFPGAIYLCSYWYMPKDLATRISYFYCASALSGAFSGLLAAAIAKMDGVGGYEGWRWIFLLEGIVTVALGVSCFFLLIDSPALSGRWLKPDEIRFLELQRFIKDGGRFGEEKQESFKWSDLKAVLCNWRLYMQAYILLCISACSYGTKFTLHHHHEDSWAANNLAPSSRRAIGVAFNICVGNIGGVIGSYMYLESEKPKYYTGFGLSLAFGATGFIVAFLLELSYKWGNTKKARLSEDEIRAKYSDQELLDMGDKSPLFRYTL
ncbi:unnamed protein product [Alternaria alternata]